MSISKSVLATVALGLATLMSKGDACICTKIFKTVCDHYEAADVVIHAKALSRSDGEISTDDDVTYTVNAITLYKTEPDVVYAGVLQIVTSSDSCGIDMDIGSEYFVDLVRDENDDLRAVGLCGGFKPWDEVTDDELELLQERCENYNTCEDCTTFQECLVHLEGTDLEQHYCADVCDPSPCAKDEVCTLEPVFCIALPTVVCPPVATCTPIVDDPCDGRCGEFQECLIYLEGARDEEAYCADFCDPRVCAKDEECYLDDSVICKERGPCPPPAACRPI